MWLIIVTLLTILIYIYQKSKNKYFWKCVLEIPGPKLRPVIGNLPDLLTDSEQSFLNRRRWAREYYPIYKFSSLGVTAVGVLHPEDIQKILSNPKNIEKGLAYSFLKRWLSTGLLTSSAKKWKGRRRLITPAFHFSILKEFIAVFNRQAENLVQELASKVTEPFVDLMKHSTRFSLNCIMETSMGVKLTEPKLRESYTNALSTLGQTVAFRINRPYLLLKPLYLITKTFKDEKFAVQILHKFSNTVIQQRKKTFINNPTHRSAKSQVMLDLLLAAQSSGADINDEGVREEVDTVLFAGHDTTATTISFCLMLLATEKDHQERIVQEIQEVLGDSNPNHSDLQELPYMERCIKEVMRLFPAIPMVNRVTGEEIKTVSGHILPKGVNVNIYIYDIHRSPQLWENPEKFDPDRFLPENVAKRHPFAYLPFSAGYRNCLGQKFAMLEVKAAICSILRKFRLEPVDTPQSVKFKTDIVLRPCDKIRVKFVLRN